MPILPAEPDFFPEDLWRRPAPLDPEGVWWCLHAKPRQEKAIARELRVAGVSYFLPQVIIEGRTPAGRKRRSLGPLFPGYLFLHGGHESRLAALRGDRLVSILEVPDQKDLEADLRQLQCVLGSGLLVMREPVHPVGSRVRILSGPLLGVEGLVVRRGQQDRFTALVRFLGQGATVDLEDWQVEPLTDEGPIRSIRTG